MSRLLAAIDAYAAALGEGTALVDTHASVSWRELPAQIATRAQMIVFRGCRVVGLELDNGADWVLWDLACIKAGVVCVPLPAFFSDGQRRHVITAAGIDHLVTRKGIIATDATPVALPSGTAKMTFTSGTTGAPKGVCLPQAGLEQVAESIVTTVGTGRDEHHLSLLPLGILLENIAGVWSALFAGSTVHVPGLADIGLSRPFQPNFARMLQVIRDQEISTAILVPELLRGLTAQLQRIPLPLPALRFVAVGGAKVAPELILRARSLGLPVYEGYGLSECGSVIALNTPGNDLPGSAGRLLPHVQAWERDREIIVANAIFTGYIDEPHSGPFATGDLGVIDADGYVHLRGRARHVIITSFGRNISPEWVESVLLDQSEIAQAIVYGEGRPAVAALVVPGQAGADIDSAIRRANLKLPEYARITRHDVVASFSIENGLLTANGRPRRTAILAAHQSICNQEDSHELLRSTR